METSEGFIKIVQLANNFYSEGSSRLQCKPFLVGGKQVGWIRPDVLQELIKCPRLYDFTRDEAGDVQQVHLSKTLTTPTERTAAVEKYLEELRDNGIFNASLKGWRNERYAVRNQHSEEALFDMERSATSLFGLRQFGVHINGYLHHPSRGLCMWIAKRALTKATWPGMLDQMVAGGLAAGQSVMDCARKESQEEASVPDHILCKLKPVGSISYFYEDERGLFPECQFIMDLEVPEDFTPVNADGEVGGFQLLPIEEVKELILSDNFKFNCRVVVLNFLIRNGLIDPDKEPNYTRLVEMMSDCPYAS